MFNDRPIPTTNAAFEELFPNDNGRPERTVVPFNFTVVECLTPGWERVPKSVENAKTKNAKYVEAPDAKPLAVLKNAPDDSYARGMMVLECYPYAADQRKGHKVVFCGCVCVFVRLFF